MLRVVFEEATLMQSDFYCEWKWDAICMCPITCAYAIRALNYALIAVFKSISTRSYLCRVEKFYPNPDIWSRLRKSTPHQSWSMLSCSEPYHLMLEHLHDFCGAFKFLCEEEDDRLCLMVLQYNPQISACGMLEKSSFGEIAHEKNFC